MNQSKSSRVAKWIWEGSILLIVILVGVLFWQYQKAEKTNRALFLQNQKIERTIAAEKEGIAMAQSAIAADLEAGVPLVAVHLRNRSWYGPPASGSSGEIERALIHQLKDERQQVQAHAIIGLRYFITQNGGRSPYVSAIVSEVTPFLYNPRLRYFAMNTLRQAGPQAKAAAPDMLATVSSEYWYPVRQATMDARRADPNFDLSSFLARYIVEDRYGKETFKNLVENFQPHEVVAAYQHAAEMEKTSEKQEHVRQVLAYLQAESSRAGSWSDVDFQRSLKSTNQPQDSK